MDKLRSISFISRIFMAAAVVVFILMASGCDKKKGNLQAEFPEKFEGKTVELITFGDSVVLDSAVVSGGKVLFDLSPYLTDSPVLAQLTIDGRVKGYAVVEPGAATMADSMYVAKGTPLNDRFAALLSTMDSIENLDDMYLYADYAEKFYNENRDNTLSDYFGVEWIKYADPARLDSMLSKADKHFAEMPRAKKAIDASRLRLATSPGNKYVDFSAYDATGKPMKLSEYIVPGKYTLIDFWASWCPYCIKEMPQLKDIYSKYSDKGLEIVGVAVRDKTEDTAHAVEIHEIPWKVMYGAERVPYDIYGFSGIPHHILIGPDGVIISRGESAAQLAARLENLMNQQ